MSQVNRGNFFSELKRRNVTNCSLLDQSPILTENQFSGNMAIHEDDT
jgi:hypothetical protein